MIQWAARQAAGVVTVSRALKDALVALGVPAESIQVLRNGVDLTLFSPVDRERVRQRLGMKQRTLLSVGNLLAFKGHHIAIRALSLLPDCELVIIGAGPERPALDALARQTGVGERVRFAGSIGQEQLREYYGAADALVLASSREGWANVLLEAMACGTPVVASDVWGNREVVKSPAAGILVDQCSAEGVAEACVRLLSAPPAREATRAYAEGFDWS